MNKVLPLIAVLLVTPLSLFAKDPLTATVKRVIDGDTIELVSGEKVRLIGIDCPEMKDGKRNRRNADTLGVDYHNYRSYAKESTIKLKDIVWERDVKLEFDPVKQEFINDEEANRLIDQPSRSSWAY